MQSHTVKDYDTYAKLGQFQEAAKCLQSERFSAKKSIAKARIHNR